jgi:hypothetical protein
LQAVVLEALLILGSYAALSFLLDSASALSLDSTVTFLAVFVPISFLLRCIDVDYKDQLARVAFFQLGVKIFNILT